MRRVFTNLLKGVKHAKNQKEKFKIQVFTLHYQFLQLLGKMEVWTLWQDCLEVNGEWIPSLWWLIDFKKWLISFVAKRPWMHQIQQIFTLKRLCDCVQFQNQSPHIKTPSCSLFFGEFYGRSLEPGCGIVLHIILKRIKKLRLSIEFWVIY